MMQKLLAIAEKANAGPTDQPTRRTDEVTYKGACTRLKKEIFCWVLLKTAVGKLKKHIDT